MIRVHVFCEGQTEESFVIEVLQAHFNTMGIYLNPIVARTSRTGKGGIPSYAKIKWQIEKKCKEDPNAWVTTLIDYYGSPSDFPGKKNAEKFNDPYQKVAHIEQAFSQDISQKNFIANLLLHEYEALLLTDVDKFSDWLGADVAAALSKETADFKSPEHINNSKETAPSKRIIKHCKNYDKPVFGSLIAMDIGLNAIRQSCLHFNGWLNRIEALAN
jgi:hypothetical protein